MKKFLVKEIITIETCYTVEAEHKFDAEDNFLKGHGRRAPKCDTEHKEFEFMELAEDDEED